LKIKISCECKDFLALGELTEFQGGLKTRTEFDVDKIVRSIRKYGIAFPLFVWRHDGVNHCLDGHGRLLALKRMAGDGDTIPPLPVVQVDCKDERSARDLLLRLNSHYGTMTKESVLEFADGFDLDLGDFDLPAGILDLTPPIEETEGDDDVPEADKKEEPDSQPGEMYELGNSILMCGDSTDPEAVARLMGGEKADMVFTDPPYGVSIGDKNKALNSVQKAGCCCENIENDTLPADVLYDVLVKAMNNCRENCKDDASYYVTSPQGGELGLMMMMMKDAGLTVRHILIWEKNAPTFSLGRLDYDYQHEPIFYTWTKSHHNYRKGKYRSTIWKYNKPQKCDLHPTMKPVALVVNCLEDATKQGDIVLDMFGGSGTTLIASEQTGRSARLMELSPHYCDVIRRRYTKWAKENNKLLTSGCLE
jgi:DNA modification methylase